MATTNEISLRGYEDYHPLRLAGAGRFWDRDGQRVRRPLLGRNKKDTLSNIQIVDQYIQDRNSRILTLTTTQSPGLTTTQSRDIEKDAVEQPLQDNIKSTTLRVYNDTWDLYRGRSFEAPRTSLPFPSGPISPPVQRPRARSACQDELFLPPAALIKSWEVSQHHTANVATENRLSPRHASTHDSKKPSRSHSRPHSSSLPRSPGQYQRQDFSEIPNTPKLPDHTSTSQPSHRESLFSDIDLLIARKSSIYSKHDGCTGNSIDLESQSPSPLNSPPLGSPSPVSICTPPPVNDHSAGLSNSRNSRNILESCQTVQEKQSRNNSLQGTSSLEPSLPLNKQLPKIPDILYELASPAVEKESQENSQDIFPGNHEIAHARESQVISSQHSPYGESKFNTLPGEPFPLAEQSKPITSPVPMFDIIQTDHNLNQLTDELCPDQDLLPWFVRYAGGKGVNIYSGP